MSFLVRCLNVGRHSLGLNCDVSHGPRHERHHTESPHGGHDCHPPPNNRFGQDGYYSALAIFLLLFALNTSLSLSRWITVEQTLPIQPAHQQLVFITQQLVSVMVMMTIMCNRRLFLHVPRPTAPSSCKRWRRILCDNMTVFCTFTFLMIGLFREVFPVYGHITCMDVYRLCGQDTPFTIEVIYKLSRATFMICEFSFCAMFHASTFQAARCVAVSLMVIAATNLGVWMEMMLCEARVIFDYSDYPWYSQCPRYIHTGNVTTAADQHRTECLYKTTDAFEHQKQVATFTYTVHIEFAIIVTEIILHLFYSMKQCEKFIHTAVSIVQESDTEREASCGIYNSDRLAEDYHETTPLLRSTTTEKGKSTTHTLSGYVHDGPNIPHSQTFNNAACSSTDTTLGKQYNWRREPWVFGSHILYRRIQRKHNRYITD